MDDLGIKPTANDIQVAGDHYKTKYQHWDMLVMMGYTSEYFVGQATKYISRWRKKNGIPDLKKGQHFIQKLIELTTAHGNNFLKFGGVSDWDMENLLVQHAETHLRDFFSANETQVEEQAICVTVLFANTADRLQSAVEAVDNLIASVIESEEAAIFGGTNRETPVSEAYNFLGYTDHDTIKWQSKATGQTQDLPLTTPPTMAIWTA